jgi:hypothetical protein
MGRCLLHESDLPEKYAMDALMYAAYILNRAPNKRLQGRYTLELMCIIIRNYKKHKMGARAKVGIFLGYGPYKNRGCLFLTKETVRVIMSLQVTPVKIPTIIKA